MLDIVDRIRNEKAVISGAPYSFLIVALILASVIWGAEHYAFKNSLEDAQEQTSNWRDRADSWKSDAEYWKDLAQRPVTGVTPNPVQPSASPAKTTPQPKSVLPAKPKVEPSKKPEGEAKIGAVQTQTCATGPCVNGDNGTASITNNFGAVPRVLTPAQSALLAQNIGPPAEGFGGIYCVIGDSEGCRYADKLIAIFQSQGWPIKGLVQGAFTNPPSGLELVASSQDVMSPPEGLKRTYFAFKKAGIDIRAVKSDSEPKGSFFILVGDNPTS